MLNIFATQFRRSEIVQTINSIRTNNLSLDWKDSGYFTFCVVNIFISDGEQHKKECEEDKKTSKQEELYPLE